MSTCMNKSKQLLNSRNTVSQQILAAVTTRIVVDKSTDHAKPHSICFYHNIKDNEINLCQDLLTIENTDSDLKLNCKRCIMQMSSCTRQTFLSKTFANSLNMKKFNIPLFRYFYNHLSN